MREAVEKNLVLCHGIDSEVAAPLGIRLGIAPSNHRFSKTFRDDSRYCLASAAVYFQALWTQGANLERAWNRLAS